MTLQPSDNITQAIDLLRNEGIDFHLMVFYAPRAVIHVGRSDNVSNGWMLNSLIEFIHQNVEPGKEKACADAICELVRDIFHLSESEAA